MARRGGILVRGARPDRARDAGADQRNELVLAGVWARLAMAAIPLRPGHFGGVLKPEIGENSP